MEHKYLKKAEHFLKNHADDIKKIQQRFNEFFSKIKQKIKESFVQEHFEKIKNNELFAKISNAKPMVIMLVAVAVIFSGVFGYVFLRNYMMNQFLKTAAEPTIAVSTIKVETQDWQPKFNASGSLRAVRGVNVTTEIAGLVRSIEFSPGAIVNSGDVLVKLNSDAEEAQLQSLKALAELAKITYERNKLQFEIKAISKETLDRNTADLNNKNAQVAEQAATLAKKTITAPFNGRLGISVINLGQYLNAGDMVVTLQSLDPLYFDFYVPQQIINQIAIDQSVIITSDAFPGEEMIGKITTIDPKADPETRNVQVEVTIGNPETKLLPGMFAQVEVKTGNVQQYLTVPQTAISFNPYGELVYLVRETDKKDKKGNPILTVKQSFVKVGLSRGDQVAVLSGLKAGDIVVTSGQNKLRNGARVFINNTVLPDNNISPKVVNE